MRSFRAALGAVTLVSLTGIALAGGGLSLQINGQTASTRVRMLDGEAYVPVQDVARALGQNVVKTPGGLAIVAAGGANQVNGARQGKIGDVLFTGEFRFQVLDVKIADSYTTRFAAEHQNITPLGSDSTLAVVTCRIKNGTRTRQELVLSTGRYGGPNTALTDDAEHSYQPIGWHGNAFGGYDAHMDEGSPDGAYVLPGAAIDLALVFNVPRGTHPKALVFSLLKYGERSAASSKAVDVRVNL